MLNNIQKYITHALKGILQNITNPSMKRKKNILEEKPTSSD